MNAVAQAGVWPAPWTVLDADQAAALRGKDPVWEIPTNRINRRLREGMTVELVTDTIGHCSRGRVLVPESTLAVVEHARTPCVRGVGYFANLDAWHPELGLVRCRAPHGALRRIPAPRRPAACAGLLDCGVIESWDGEETLYWSNRDGWGHLSTASVWPRAFFTNAMLPGNLPAIVRPIPLAWAMDPRLRALNQGFGVLPEAVRSILVAGIRRTSMSSIPDWERDDQAPEAIGVYVGMCIGAEPQPAGYFAAYGDAIEHANAIAEESFRSIDDRTSAAIRW